MRIAICDDDTTYIEDMKNEIREIAEKEKLQIHMELFFNGNDLLQRMHQEAHAFDLLLLDIEMNQMDGLSLAREIRKFDHRVYLIYITSHKTYALEAYDVHPYGFIVKPVKRDILSKSILDLYDRVNDGSNVFEYKKDGGISRVPIGEIVYFESKKRKIIIHLENGETQEYYGKLNAVETYFQERGIVFWRIHCSYLINPRYVQKKFYDHVLLFEDSVLPISKNKRSRLDISYVQMVEHEMV